MTNTPRYCRYCGHELSTPGDRYCANCGRATEFVPDAAPAAAPVSSPVFDAVPRGIYESPRTRANWTLALFGVLVICVVLSFGSTLAEINLLQRVVDGEAVTEQELIANDDRQSAVSGFLLVAHIALVVAFCMWAHRASKNLRALAVEGQRFSPGWSVGWWFVPIMNLFRPYQVTREIWRGSDPSITRQDPQAWQNAPVTPILGWWWGTWLASNFVLLGAWRALTSDDVAAEELITANYFSLASDALTMVAAVLAFMLVRGITANQEAKHLRLGAAGHF